MSDPVGAGGWATLAKGLSADKDVG
jgi:hypothetical protein